MIAQTLHGYSQGHRLLATGGHVNENELAQLDRLSDLSGYVPVGTEFDHYYTGFPCGRYYAFACTWPDRMATRAGTVLTHTLLIPRAHLETIQDLWNVPGHRRPESALDRAPYEEALPLDIDHAANPALTPAPERAAAAIALWFGQPERPVLWIEEGGAEDIVRYLWSLLWQETRESFSFCTFALQVRFLRKKPFGFLVLPPSARGAFHDRARSGAWWIDGQLTNAALRERAKQAWVGGIFERGVASTQLMARFCAKHGLTPLDELAYPVFYRFAELEEPAAVRIAAARARADLLERLWPQIDPLHPLVGAILGQLAKLQSDAPLAPRPFWDLIDFVKRGALRPWMDTHDELATEWSGIIGREVERRLVEAERIEGLGALLNAAPHPKIHEEIIRAAMHLSERHSREPWFFAKACAVLASSVEARNSSLVSAVFQPLPSPQRSALAIRALEESTESSRAALSDYILITAHQLSDVNLKVDVWLALEQPLRALEEATADSFDLMSRVLARLGPEERLTWALGVDDPRWASRAGKKGAEAAKELGLRLPEIIERCRAAPNEGAVVLACLDELAISELRDDDLASDAIATALASDADASPAAKRLAEYVAPQIIRRIADGSWKAEQTDRWFALPALQRAFADVAPSMLYGRFDKARLSDCLPNIAKASASAAQSHTVTSLRSVVNVLAKPLQDATKTSFSRAENDLLVLVKLPIETDGWLLLAAHVLVAVKNNPTASAHRLVEHVFPALYGPIVRNQLEPASFALLRVMKYRDWDTAKRWRHWLLDTWLDEGWPPASFLRAMGDDSALFRRIAYRAWHKRKAEDFIKRLPYALTNDADLARRWRVPVADFLANPKAKIDYD